MKTLHFKTLLSCLFTAFIAVPFFSFLVSCESEKLDINRVFHQQNLGYIEDETPEEIVLAFNQVNNANVLLNNFKITPVVNIPNYKALVEGINGNYGKFFITYELKKELSEAVLLNELPIEESDKNIGVITSSIENLIVSKTNLKLGEFELVNFNESDRNDPTKTSVDIQGKKKYKGITNIKFSYPSYDVSN
jgi:hypothetical protein